MTPRERVEAVLLHQGADQVPFTVYECLIPQCETERKLRNEGLCIVNRLSVVEIKNPDVTEKTCHYHDEDGVLKIRRDIRTPYGDLFTVDRPAPNTIWQIQKIFKGPEDYKAIEFMIRHNTPAANYEPFLRAQKLSGDDIVLRISLGYDPLQEIMISIMGVETFSLEWMNNRDEVLRLYNALLEERRKIFPLIARSPARYINCTGNISPEIVGYERFEKYILPYLQECAEVMHKNGKVIGGHFDANTRLLAPLLAESGLDYIEAFTPPPDGDLSVGEALEAWPEMVLWINFPSSVQLQEAGHIEKAMQEILKQSIPGDRLIAGITENVPDEHWQKSFSAISHVLNTEGKLPLRGM